MARWPWSKIPLVPSDAEILRRYRDGEYPELHRWDAYRHPRLLDAVERAALAEAEAGPYPIHGRNTIRPRTPFTWFKCQNGHRDMGSPTKKPKGECFECRMRQLDARWRGEESETPSPEPTIWTPVSRDESYAETLKVDADHAPRTIEGLPNG